MALQLRILGVENIRKLDDPVVQTAKFQCNTKDRVSQIQHSQR
jgi:hypothetical protein